MPRPRDSARNARCLPSDAGIAQLVERLIRNQQVPSSSLGAGSKAKSEKRKSARPRFDARPPAAHGPRSEQLTAGDSPIQARSRSSAPDDTRAAGAKLIVSLSIFSPANWGTFAGGWDSRDATGGRPRFMRGEMQPPMEHPISTRSMEAGVTLLGSTWELPTLQFLIVEPSLLCEWLQHMTLFANSASTSSSRN